MRSLPAGLEIAAFRVVQEALTNSLKHGGRSHTRVEICYGNTELTVAVVNDGSARPGTGSDAGNNPSTAPDSGHGLIGMRERVALYGGQLTAGPELDGGFAVRARLPIPQLVQP